MTSYRRATRSILAALRAGRFRVLRRLIQPVQEFIQTESAGGMVLLAAALVPLAWANSPWDDTYSDLGHTELVVDVAWLDIRLSLEGWVNDALMAVFFLVVGLTSSASSCTANRRAFAGHRWPRQRP